MRVLLLPGFSPEHRGELDLICTSLGSAGFDCQPHLWRHWEEPGVAWNNRAELAALEERIDGYGGAHFILLGLSVGTYLACQILVGHPELLDQVSHLVLMGIPLKDTRHIEAGVYPAALTRYPGPITVIQNSDDPYARATQIDSLLTGAKANLIVKESNNHTYPYAEEITEILQPAHAGT
jgi:pimeloyl-ACP methyl ester carboxylesterase